MGDVNYWYELVYRTHFITQKKMKWFVILKYLFYIIY